MAASSEHSHFPPCRTQIVLCIQQSHRLLQFGVRSSRADVCREVIFTQGHIEEILPGHLEL